MLGKIKAFIATILLIVVMLYLASHEYQNLLSVLDINNKDIAASIASNINAPRFGSGNNGNNQTFSKTNATNTTDPYVSNNYNYKSSYINTVNRQIKSGRGYVSLNRILYFYNANPNLSFDEIYVDNLDTDNTQKKISDTCKMDKYKNMSVCTSSAIASSNQIDYKQSKVFNYPVDMNNATITSFFMENRSYENHKAWDIAAKSGTDVVSVCDGVVSTVNFNHSSNYPSRGYGNYIEIKCTDSDYRVLYAHLYPNSAQVRTGESVKHYQTIAKVGNTGNSTGSHLHFEVQNSNTYVDGMSLIKP